MSRFKKEIIMFLVGYCVYISIEVTFRGYSYMCMGICGGLLFILIDNINNRISWDIDVLAQGCVGSVLITFCELIVGETIKFLGQAPMWNYSNMLFNFDGVICLEYSLLWVGMSLIAIVVADSINYYVFKELPIPYYKFCGKTIYKFKQI